MLGGHRNQSYALPRPGTIPTMMHKSGSREELVKVLNEMAEGWHHLCKDKLRDQAFEAADALSDGAVSAKVGRTTYSVTDV